MPSGEGNENGEKTTIVLTSRKASLHVQHTFFVHFFAVVLHDYNAKLPRMPIYRTGTRARTSTQDSSLDSTICRFPAISSSCKFHDHKEEGSRGNHGRKARVRVRIRVGRLRIRLGVLFVTFILLLFICLLIIFLLTV